MSGEETKITLDDCMKAAFQALLRGDTAERDRLCRAATTAFGDRDSVPADTPVDLAAFAKTMHPDAGGLVEGFQELTEAREQLKGGNE